MKKIKFFVLGLIYSSMLSAQCNNWLDTRSTANGVSSVRVGQNNSITNPGINVTGNQLTVEAKFYSTSLAPNTTGQTPIDLVSKHQGAADANYLLRINQAELTTSTGFFSTGSPCSPIINKMYHVAMVYNGQTLRFYRNGILMNSVACTGTLTQNNWATSIGWEQGSSGTWFANFLGYINEVRIWNVARTQAQIQQFLNTPLPNPTTQNGLLAYYQFNSLINLASPGTFNGSLQGGALLNAVLPNCNFVIDSCEILPPAPCQQTDTTINVEKCNSNNITLNARVGNSYSWTPATGLSATNVQNPICSATTNTTYTCTITTTTMGTSCTYRDNFIVTVNPTPASFIRDTSICRGDTIQLNATNGTNFNWSPATNINNTTIGNPIVWPSITTPYNCTIINQFGCSATQTYNVSVNNCRCEDSCNWNLKGNTYVKPNYFIGSLNNADFKIRTNNTQRMIITASGNVGIGTSTPSKLLQVNGEVNISNLPPAIVNNSLVLANGNGDLKSLAASGSTAQYLSGNGTWQNLPITSNSINANQGCTLSDNSTVVLGSSCFKNAGLFQESRKINMNDLNLYFNSAKQGKLYMGNTSANDRECLKLATRLEISSNGLEAINEYSDLPSTSGLRFSNLTAIDKPIENKYNGVLSLDENGDVIWVQACCNNAVEKNALNSILNRLEKLEKELVTSKLQTENLTKQLGIMNVILEKSNAVILNQNTPNPFAESTVITYNIPIGFKTAQIIFTSNSGEIVKIVDIKSAGKGMINIYAQGIASGLYTYTLKIDGLVIMSKKMVKM